jgi:hypothetical protein
MNTYQKTLFRTACKAISEEIHDKKKFSTIIRQEGERFWLENHKEEITIKQFDIYLPIVLTLTTLLLIVSLFLFTL